MTGAVPSAGSPLVAFSRPARWVVVVGLVLATLPVAAWVYRTWFFGTLGGAGAGLLAAPMAALLCAVAHRRPPAPRAWGPTGAWLLLLVASALSIAGALLVPTDPAAWMLCGIALPLALFAWLWGGFGPTLAAQYAFPTFFAYFALPWELFLREMDPFLQVQSARLAVWVLTAAGYDLVWWNDHTFYDVDYYLIVNETCSGLNMLVTLGMYTLVFGWVTLHTLTDRAVLLVCVPPLAWLANGLRIAAIWLIGKHSGDELAQGFWHTGSAYLLFLPVFWVLYRVSRGLARRRARALK